MRGTLAESWRTIAQDLRVLFIHSSSTKELYNLQCSRPRLQRMHILLSKSCGLTSPRPSCVNPATSRKQVLQSDTTAHPYRFPKHQSSSTWVAVRHGQPADHRCAADRLAFLKQAFDSNSSKSSACGACKLPLSNSTIQVFENKFLDERIWNIGYMIDGKSTYCIFIRIWYAVVLYETWVILQIAYRSSF
jgi:hypothetical protein